MLHELKENTAAQSVRVTQLTEVQSTGLLTKCRTHCKTFLSGYASVAVAMNSALTLMPCKSTSGTELHGTNNSITSLRTQMDEDAMYGLSLLWRLPSANEITDYIQTGDTEAEVQCKHL